MKKTKFHHFLRDTFDNQVDELKHEARESSKLKKVLDIFIEKESKNFYIEDNLTNSWQNNVNDSITKQIEQKKKNYSFIDILSQRINVIANKYSIFETHKYSPVPVASSVKIASLIIIALFFTISTLNITPNLFIKIAQTSDTVFLYPYNKISSNYYTYTQSEEIVINPSTKLLSNYIKKNSGKINSRDHEKYLITREELLGLEAKAQEKSVKNSLKNKQKNTKNIYKYVKKVQETLDYMGEKQIDFSLKLNKILNF